MEYEEYHLPNDASQNASGQDDGSLKCLGLPIPDGMKIFKCNETTQQQMENKTFWVFDYDKGVKTRHGADKYIVFFKYNRDDTQETSYKFFTGSPNIKVVLDQLRELKAFPRKVTLRRDGNTFYFE